MLLKSSTHIEVIFSNISTNGTLCVNLTNSDTFYVKVAQRFMQYVSILLIITHFLRKNRKLFYAKCVNLTAFNTFCIKVRQT